MFIRFKGDVNALHVDKRHFLTSSSIVDVMGDVQIKRRFKNLKNKIKLVKREKMWQEITNYTLIKIEDWMFFLP